MTVKKHNPYSIYTTKPFREDTPWMLIIRFPLRHDHFIPTNAFSCREIRQQKKHTSPLRCIRHLEPQTVTVIFPRVPDCSVGYWREDPLARSLLFWMFPWITLKSPGWLMGVRGYFMCGCAKGQAPIVYRKTLVFTNSAWVNATLGRERMLSMGTLGVGWGSMLCVWLEADFRFIKC